MNMWLDGRQLTQFIQLTSDVYKSYEMQVDFIIYVWGLKIKNKTEKTSNVLNIGPSQYDTKMFCWEM